MEEHVHMKIIHAALLAGLLILTGCANSAAWMIFM